jgi:transposase-like protein
MDISRMSEQQILEYLRKTSTSPKSVGTAKGLAIENFFQRHSITIRCPHCQSAEKIKNGTNGSGIPRYKCRKCGKNYSLTVNTIFDGTSYSVEEMVNAVHAVITQQSSVNMESNVGKEEVHNSAAWLLVRKIQSILASMRTPLLTGVIEVDEKYIKEAQKGSERLRKAPNGLYHTLTGNPPEEPEDTPSVPRLASSDQSLSISFVP